VCVDRRVGGDGGSSTDLKVHILDSEDPCVRACVQSLPLARLPLSVLFKLARRRAPHSNGPIPPVRAPGSAAWSTP
jgi:hypothetical protein